MDLREDTAGRITILEVKGRVDSTTAPALGEKMNEFLATPQRRLVLDLRQLEYISSAGFRVLLITNRATAEKQGKLALCGVTGEVRRLFEIGSFMEQFLICQTQADGIGKLRQ